MMPILYMAGALVAFNWTAPTNTAGLAGYQVAITRDGDTHLWEQPHEGFTNALPAGEYHVAVMPIGQGANWQIYEFPALIVPEPKPVVTTQLLGRMMMAENPGGPYRPFAQFSLEVPVMDTNGYFRAEAELKKPPEHHE